MKAEYIVPSIIIMDYELYLSQEVVSEVDGDDGEDMGTKYRGDGTIPIVDMGGDDEW